MKRLFATLSALQYSLMGFGVGLMIFGSILGIGGCTSPTTQTTIYQSIAATETGVIALNSGYLDSVVTGVTPTNSVPTVEKAFNDIQLALHTAASLASGGSTAPVSPLIFQQAVAFTNTVNSVKGK